MPVLLDTAYVIVLLLCSPYLLFRIVTSGRYRKGLAQRLGVMPRAVIAECRGGDSRPIWIHAASVGEVNAAGALIEGLARRFPGKRWVISCLTSAGVELARTRYGEGKAFYFPLDLSWTASAALKRIRPCCLVLIELELWPNMLRLARRRGVPVVLLNGRIREGTVRRLRRLRPLLGPVCRDVPDLYCVQTEEYRERFARLGVPDSRLRVTGTMKYDTVATLADPGRAAVLRDKLGTAEGAPLIVAGSTWPGEEAALLAAYARLRKGSPRLRLLLAPRHVERTAEVEAAARAAGFEPRRLSRAGGGDVTILDTMGELVAAYSLATVAFVGRSLCAHGGQNMLEPAALGVPVIFGPHTENFRSEAELLVAAGAAEVVVDGESLCRAIERLLADPDARARMAEAARAVIARNRGATARNLDALAELLGRST